MRTILIPSRAPQGHAAKYAVSYAVMGRRKLIPVFLAAACVASLSGGEPLTRGQDAPAGAPAAQQGAAFDVRRGSLIVPVVRAAPGEGFSVELPLAGGSLTLDLVPHSVRSAHYRLLEQGADGIVSSVPPGPVRTLRGAIRGVPDSVVAASLLDEGLCAQIQSGTNRYWLEPLRRRIEAALVGAHVLHAEEEVSDKARWCAVAADLAMAPAPQEAGAVAGGPCESGTYVAELACDSDYEYFLDYGSVEAVEERINAIINAVNVEYERDVGIRHELTAIVVRTAEPDPYPDNWVLDDFRQEWMTNQATIPRDVAHMFSGKPGPGGVAWTIGAICEFEEHYAVSNADCCGDACAITIPAHELGHLWGGAALSMRRYHEWLCLLGLVPSFLLGPMDRRSSGQPVMPGVRARPMP